MGCVVVAAAVLSTSDAEVVGSGGGGLGRSGGDSGVFSRAGGRRRGMSVLFSGFGFGGWLRLRSWRKSWYVMLVFLCCSGGGIGAYWVLLPEL